MSGKRLYLIRHAKSSWAQAGLSDHDRPLNDRGNGDAPGMADRLLRCDKPPMYFLVSSAQRTRETFAHIAQRFAGIEHQVEFREELYLAGVRQIQDQIAQIPDWAESAALIGHNPGISDAAAYLSGEPVNMVTSHVVGLELHVEEWGEVSRDTGSIVYFDFPKKHRSL